MQEYMVCRKCGNEMQNDDVFCSKCGMKNEGEDVQKDATVLESETVKGLQVDSGQIKKNKRKRRFIVGGIIFVLVIIFMLAGGEEASPIELMPIMAREMSRQEIKDYLGEPDEIMYDDEEKYYYIYDDVLTIMGSNEKLSNMALTMSPNIDQNKYKLHEVKLGDSYSDIIRTYNVQEKGEREGENMAILGFSDTDEYKLAVLGDKSTDIIKTILLLSEDTINEYMDTTNQESNLDLIEEEQVTENIEEIEPVEPKKEEQVVEEIKANYIDHEAILKLLSQAHDKVNNILSGYDYESESELDGYYPLSNDFNTYEKMRNYLSTEWCEGYTEVLLSEISYMLKLVDGKYYMMAGDIGPTTDFNSGIILSVQDQGNKKVVLLDAKNSFGNSSQIECALVYENEKWKVTDDRVGQVQKSDIYIESVDSASLRSEESGMSVASAKQIALSNYPQYTNWSQGEMGENTYGDPCHVFTAFDGENRYVIFVGEDGSCYARFVGM